MQEDDLSQKKNSYPLSPDSIPDPANGNKEIFVY
jgi:hypothetical protein